MSRRPFWHGASALLVVLWALLIITAAVFAWARWIREDVQMSGQANRGTEARAMAHSGVAAALHPLVSKQTGLLQEELGNALGYRARLISEGGKLNLPWLMAGEDPRKIALFKEWLATRGLSFQEREILTDCLLDYIDPDNVHRLNGVEDEGDYHAANRPLESIDELAQVRGSGPLTRTPGWQDDLTMDSSGPIDILAAPASVLRLVPGLGEARLQRLLKLRRGPDGLDGTADDPEFQSLAQVLALLGMQQAEVQALNGLITINDPVVRILSEGHSGKVVRQVEVVARKNGGYPQILLWKE